ncbi:Cys/Met metabolism PLP-dependent enzyme-domain-containing protein [Pholiota molesta]|nr:Cys/Met metabolism PLP-dependent enzyme-domain-containing protein [Pholiota molesta]
MSPKPQLNGTTLIHGDARFAGSEVAPSISVSTSAFLHSEVFFQNSSIEDLDIRNPTRHVYSRYTQEVSTRAEHILSRINASLAASYAALVFYRPKRIAIRGGYHGCHATIDVYKKNQGIHLEVIDLDSEYRAGDLCWLETPLNPTGESRDIQYYADKIHKAGGKLLVDSTFGPPPLQYPFRFGTDWLILNDSFQRTKYFGGHSDLLAGVLVVKTLEEWNQLHSDRTFLGSMMGSLESWLLLRSLRTLHLRVPRQSASATVLAQWLNSIAKTPAGKTFDGIPGGIVEKVWHSSLQGMQGGWNATSLFLPSYAFQLAKPEYALEFPHILNYFVSATSLGGVESLVEHRIQSDPSSDPRLIRLSIGVEEVEDLKADLQQAFRKLASTKAKL